MYQSFGAHQTSLVLKLGLHPGQTGKSPEDTVGLKMKTVHKKPNVVVSNLWTSYCAATV